MNNPIHKGSYKSWIDNTPLAHYLPRKRFKRCEHQKLVRENI